MAFPGAVANFRNPVDNLAGQFSRPIFLGQADFFETIGIVKFLVEPPHEKIGPKNWPRNWPAKFSTKFQKLAGPGGRPIFRKSADFRPEAGCHCRPMFSKRPPPDKESMQHHCEVYTSLRHVVENGTLGTQRLPEPIFSLVDVISGRA